MIKDNTIVMFCPFGSGSGMSIYKNMHKKKPSATHAFATKLYICCFLCILFAQKYATTHDLSCWLVLWMI